MKPIRTFLHLTGAVSAALLLAACGEHGPDGHSHGSKDHDHPHPHPHAENGGAMTDPHGEKIVIGTATLGAWELSPHRFNAIVPGADLEAGVDLSPAEPAPQALRIWIGDESGRGSIKAKADPINGSPGTWHAHVTVPDPIASGAQYWVELETADGRLSQGFPIEVAADASAPQTEHTGHDHGHDHGPDGHSH